ncbi:MAG: hypothetical protein AAGJ40_23010 [Planctomycetota bacterium]
MNANQLILNVGLVRPKPPAHRFHPPGMPGSTAEAPARQHGAAIPRWFTSRWSRREVPTSNVTCLSWSPGFSRLAARPLGLTLIELVIVLVILAALTGVAVQSLEPLADQSRYEATQRTLEEVADGIIEHRLQTSGARHASGFVPDVGLVPLDLSELLDDSAVIPGTTTALSAYPMLTRSGPAAADALNPTDVDCGGVSLRCGWRGPYVSVVNSSAGLRDGWGEAFEVVQIPAATGPVHLRWPAVTAEYSDLTVDIESPSLEVVAGRILDDAGGAPLNAEVALVYPDPTVSTVNLAVMADADNDDTNSEFRFEDVPVGLRALVFRETGGGTDQAIRYIEVGPMQPELPITITEF